MMYNNIHSTIGTGLTHEINTCTKRVMRHMTNKRDVNNGGLLSSNVDVGNLTMLINYVLMLYYDY